MKEKLKNFDPQSFMAQNWQKKPALFAGAIDPTPYLISPDELAGLSMDDSIESRFITSDPAWKLQHGPFESEFLSNLPQKPWTLLVQDVDKFLPNVNEMLRYFDFLPSWRVDDIMISYATEGGGVGAHLDNYDVFLVQVRGQRKWEIEATPRQTEEYVDELPIRQLQKFEPDEAWTLGPGDILYLPPRIPHNGVAADNECMTYSVGFRAPSGCELLASFASWINHYRPDDERLYDGDQGPTSTPGQISTQHMEKIKSAIMRHLDDRSAFETWIGETLSEPKFQLETPPPPKNVSEYQEHEIARGENTRAVYLDSPTEKRLLFFVNGSKVPTSGSSKKLIKDLCDARTINPRNYPSVEDQNLIKQLISKGDWY